MIIPFTIRIFNETGKAALFLLVTAASLASCITVVYAASSAGEYTLSIPSGITSTMGEATVTIPVTVTNSASSSDSIGYVRIDFSESVYYVSNATNAPTGWTVAEVKNAGLGQTYVLFTTTTNKIAAGGAQTFSIVLTGSGDANIPSAALDQIDSINDGGTTTVMTIADKNSNYFTRAATGNSDTWIRRSFFSSIDASPLSLGVGETITIIQSVTNRSSGSQATVQPASSVPTLFGTGSAVLLSGPTPVSTGTLVSGDATTFEWTYEATAEGTISFCNSAKNGAATATSDAVCSDAVYIGNFTASISVYPDQIVGGQSVTVSMTVSNNGSLALNNIVPTLNAPAGSTYVSGPGPGTIGNLGAGASSAFQWVYTLAGATGDTFQFSGFATAQGGVNSIPSPATSNTIIISEFSLSAAPITAGSGATSQSFTFTVNNNGGYQLHQIMVTTPDTGFAYSSASGGCAGAWTVSAAATPTEITFDTGADYIPIGGSCSFTVTYSSVPTVASNTDYNFRVDVWDTNTQKNKSPTASLGTIVTITQYVMSVIADYYTRGPGCSSIITATITPDPGDGESVDYSKTAGTLDPLVSTTSGGSALTILYAPDPYDPAVTSSTVNGIYKGATDDIVVTFTNYSGCAGGGSIPIRFLNWQESY